MSNYPANAYKSKINQLIEEVESHLHTFALCLDHETNEDDRVMYKHLIRMHLEALEPLKQLRDQHERNRSYIYASETY